MIDLRARKRAVLATWPSTALIGAVFDELLDAVEHEVAEPVLPSVDAHAADHFRRGSTIGMVVREYGRLRQCMTREVSDPAVCARLAHAIDLAIERATSRYCKEREELRERFIGVLAHDLRTPLSCVTMASEMLTAGARTPQERMHLELILDASQRMQRMVTDVLAWARANLAEGFPTNVRREDFREILEAAIADTRVIHGERSVIFEASGDLRGQFDRDRLYQAFCNLLRNAVEHGTGAARVEAREIDNGATILLVVQNPGALRSPDASDIRSPFERRKRPSKARGLGLYIVDQITRAHGATLELDTSLEVTTITIRWPTRRDESAGDQPPLRGERDRDLDRA